MKRSPRARQRKQAESGYALLMVVFLVATMMIFVAAAALRVKTEGQREKEEEMIWRGQQYARAIKLYVRKSGGRYPQSLEDLTKAKNQIRFLRKAYPDPFNAEDGSWRLIYVGPQGQIIGSVKHRTAIPGFTAAAQTGAAQPAKSATPSDSQTTRLTVAATEAPEPEAAKTSLSDGKSAGDTLTGKVFGGNIIGVGSKVDKPSIKVLDGSTNYHEWEFLWDASKDLQPGLMVAPGATRQTPGTTEPGPRLPRPIGRRPN